jgi:hypothetical protein
MAAGSPAAPKPKRPAARAVSKPDPGRAARRRPACAPIRSLLPVSGDGVEPWAASVEELQPMETGSNATSSSGGPLNTTAGADGEAAAAAAAAEDAAAGPVLAYDQQARPGPLPGDVRMCGDVARRAADAIGSALRGMQAPRLQVQNARVEFSLVPGERQRAPALFAALLYGPAAWQAARRRPTHSASSCRPCRRRRGAGALQHQLRLQQPQQPLRLRGAAHGAGRGRRRQAGRQHHAARRGGQPAGARQRVRGRAPCVPGISTLLPVAAQRGRP